MQPSCVVGSLDDVERIADGVACHLVLTAEHPCRRADHLRHLGDLTISRTAEERHPHRIRS